MHNRYHQSTSNAAQLKVKSQVNKLPWACKLDQASQTGASSQQAPKPEQTYNKRKLQEPKGMLVS